MQENYEILKDLINTDCWFTLLVLPFVLEILKKKALKKKLWKWPIDWSSEND